MSARKKRSKKASNSRSTKKLPESFKPSESKKRRETRVAVSLQSGNVDDETKAVRSSSTRKGSQNSLKKSKTQTRLPESAKKKSKGGSKREYLVAPSADISARELRSQRATIGWDTRRANEKLRERMTVKANPHEEKAGDFAYTLYEKAHPLRGEIETQEYWHKALKPYYGKRVRFTINGYVTDPKTKERTRIFIQRVGNLENYADMFGAGSLYYDGVKAVRNRHSEGELVVTSVTTELASAKDKDTESFKKSRAKRKNAA